MSNVIKYVFDHCIQRTQNMSLEKIEGGMTRPITLSDMIPEEIKGKEGTYRITIEFDPNE